MENQSTLRGRDKQDPSASDSSELAWLLAPAALGSGKHQKNYRLALLRSRITPCHSSKHVEHQSSLPPIAYRPTPCKL